MRDALTGDTPKTINRKKITSYIYPLSQTIVCKRVYSNIYMHVHVVHKLLRMVYI